MRAGPFGVMALHRHLRARQPGKDGGVLVHPSCVSAIHQETDHAIRGHAAQCSVEGTDRGVRLSPDLVIAAREIAEVEGRGAELTLALARDVPIEPFMTSVDQRHATLEAGGLQSLARRRQRARLDIEGPDVTARAHLLGEKEGVMAISGRGVQGQHPRAKVV